jgi:hypothetical protein
MNRRAITPTITHRVRTFLQGQGAAVAPWSGLDETYAELFALLRRRQDDERIWEPLAELLRDVVARITHPEALNLPAPQAELLSSWDIDELVSELRTALGKPDGSTLGDFAGRLSASALGGFLLLGFLSAGCGGTTGTGTVSERGDASTAADGGDDDDDDASADGGLVLDAGSDAALDATVEDAVADAANPPWADGCTLDPTSTLYQTIAGSSLSDYQKTGLCQCFSTLNASWNQGLTDLFLTATPEEVAAALQEMTECCTYDSGTITGEFASARDALLSGTLCYVALPYRGVAFPEE